MLAYTSYDADYSIYYASHRLTDTRSVLSLSKTGGVCSARPLKFLFSNQIRCSDIEAHNYVFVLL